MMRAQLQSTTTYKSASFAITYLRLVGGERAI